MAYCDENRAFRLVSPLMRSMERSGNMRNLVAKTLVMKMWGESWELFRSSIFEEYGLKCRNGDWHFAFLHIYHSMLAMLTGQADFCWPLIEAMSVSWSYQWLSGPRQTDARIIVSVEMINWGVKCSLLFILSSFNLIWYQNVRHFAEASPSWNICALFSRKWNVDIMLLNRLEIRAMCDFHDDH